MFVILFLSKTPKCALPYFLSSMSLSYNDQFSEYHHAGKDDAAVSKEKQVDGGELVPSKQLKEYPGGKAGVSKVASPSDCW